MARKPKLLRSDRSEPKHAGLYLCITHGNQEVVATVVRRAFADPPGFYVQWHSGEHEHTCFQPASRMEEEYTRWRLLKKFKPDAEET